MVSRFVQRTVLTHIAFLGIGYLILRVLCQYMLVLNGRADEGLPPTPGPFVFLLTLVAAMFYSFRVRKYRPVPHNPIQQFGINLVIAIYAVPIALSLAIPLSASLEYGSEATIWPLPAAIYVFFAWRHVYGVDPFVYLDPHGRPMSLWGEAIRRAKKSRNFLRRSNQVWSRY